MKKNTFFDCVCSSQSAGAELVEIFSLFPGIRLNLFSDWLCIFCIRSVRLASVCDDQSGVLRRRITGADDLGENFFFTLKNSEKRLKSMQKL